MSAQRYIFVFHATNVYIWIALRRKNTASNQIKRKLNKHQPFIRLVGLSGSGCVQVVSRPFLNTHQVALHILQSTEKVREIKNELFLSLWDFYIFSVSDKRHSFALHTLASLRNARAAMKAKEKALRSETEHLFCFYHLRRIKEKLPAISSCEFCAQHEWSREWNRNSQVFIVCGSVLVLLSSTIEMVFSSFEV